MKTEQASNPIRILLGRIAGAHGIRGELIVHSYAEAPEDIAAYGPLSDTSETQKFALKVVRVTPKGVIVRVKGLTDRNAAEALKGTELYVARSQLPKTAEDEFYHSDLIGLAAVSPEGKAVGRVVTVQNFGAGDLIEIAIDGIAKTEFVPFAGAYVPEVDIKGGRIVVRMPEGTDEDNDDDAGEPEPSEPESKA